MKIRDLFNPQSGAISSLLAPHFLPTDSLFLTKQGSLGAIYRLAGVDFECLTDEVLESITQRLHTTVRNLNPDFRIYQYVIKRKGVNLAYHRAQELYSFELYWVLLYEKKRGGLSSSKSLKISRKELDSRIEDAELQLGNFFDTAGSTLGLHRCKQEEIFSFLQKLLFSSGELRYSDHLDYWTAQTAIDIEGSRIRAGQAILPMSLRELPRSTSPNLLSDLLRLPCDLIVCSEWKRVPAEKGNKLIEKSEEHFFFKKDNRNAKEARKRKSQGEGIEDKAAKENVSNLGDFGVRAKNRGEFVGEFSLRLILSGANLERHAAEAKSYAGNFEAQLEADAIGSLNSYLSIIPGNTSRNIHKHWNLSMNYVDLALVYAPPVGDAVNRHLGKEALAIMESSLQTPVYFNLHEGDLLGALIFGIMGSGKSFTTNLLIDKSQKYDPFTFILDVGNSYRHLTAKHGGSYIELAKSGQAFTINPFDCEKNAQNLEFLSSFVHVLLATTGYTPTPQECRLIDAGVQKAHRLSALDIPESLLERLYNWVGDGRYAYLFDNDRDSLSLSDFQTFDLQGVNAKILEPLFFYIFNRISQIVYDPKNIHRPKQLFSDEAWKFLSTPTARDYFIEAGKTWRKHNGGICLITQSALDLERVGLLECINEICPTKILLGNPGADWAHYAELFSLSTREVELCRGLEKKKNFLLKTPDRSAVLSVMPSQEEIWTYSNDPNSNMKRDALIEQHGYDKAMDILTKGAAA